MTYEVWEFEYATTYALCIAGDDGVRRLAEQDGGRLVLLLEAETWEEAKSKRNDYVSNIRAKLMENEPLDAHDED